jgi:hypothetical protein
MILASRLRVLYFFKLAQSYGIVGTVKGIIGIKDIGISLPNRVPNIFYGTKKKRGAF